MIVNSIGVLSVGKMFGALYALLGVIIGAFFSLISIIGVAAGAQNAGPAALLVGAGAIIILPVFYGLLGFVGGIIMAVLYNVVASVTGGIEFELKSILSDRTY